MIRRVCGRKTTLLHFHVVENSIEYSDHVLTVAGLRIRVRFLSQRVAPLGHRLHLLDEEGQRGCKLSACIRIGCKLIASNRQ